MYSPELMKFLLNYNKEEVKSSKKVYNLKNGNCAFASKRLATVKVTVESR